MKDTLKIEEIGMFLLSVYLFSTLNFNWWWYLALFFVPDISFLGYVVNSKIGAITYNIFHHKAIAIVFYLAGIYSNNQVLQLVGIILFGHSSFDRVLGYGLKYNDNFNHTHLGKIGKQ